MGNVVLKCFVNATFKPRKMTNLLHYPESYAIQIDGSYVIVLGVVRGALCGDF